jgi:hypothetical protein
MRLIAVKSLTKPTKGHPATVGLLALQALFGLHLEVS